MKKLLRPLCYVLMIFSCCSCGWLYTNTTTPLTCDIHNGTPVMYEKGSSNQFQLQEPITAAGMKVVWASNGIGDVAKKRGLKNIYYADLIHKSILLGIYQRDTVVVYGEPFKNEEVIVQPQ